ncbi:MAG: hypothetical protein HQ575_04080, partial [Candidatus Omnitrophica bacterium]|nr:hypothetical protein [Candidatus Omnitrophota bacterium]
MKRGLESKKKLLEIEDFEIPSALGELKDKHKGKGGTIIFIQDAHCNYAAQKSISNIIGHLNENYGVNLINLEGGAGDYDLSLFTDIKDKGIREEVSDHFVQEGRLCGPELFAVNNPEKVTLYGIENEDLYIKNLDVYRDSLKYVTGVNNTLNYITSKLNDLKKHTYADELIELDKRYVEFKENTLEMKEFIQYLFDVSLKKKISLRAFPNIRLLYKAVSEEKGINFKKANSERDKLIEELKETLCDNDIDTITLKTFLYKTGQLSQGGYYGYLKKVSQENKISLKNKLNLSKYITYISHYEEADKTQAFDEIEDLFDLIADKYFENESQKELFKISKHVRILENIFNIKATKKEINYFNKHKDEFDISAILGFISREFLKIGESPHFDNSAYLIDENRDEILGFYKYAQARDEAFLKNIKKSHGIFKKETSIIVAGGFHTENLTTLFKKNGLSYLVIRPTFENRDDYKCPYYSLLSGGLSDTEAKIIESISALAIASFLNGLAIKVHGKAVVNNFRVAAMIYAKTIQGGHFLLETPKGILRFSRKNGDIVVKNIGFGLEEIETDARIDEKDVLTLRGAIDQLPAKKDAEVTAAAEPATKPDARPKVGSWFETESRFYERWVAGWFETGAAGAAWWLGAAYIHPFIGILLAAAIFWGPHYLFRGKEVARSNTVVGLTVGTVIAAAFTLFGFSLYLTFGVLAGAHFAVNWISTGKKIRMVQE